MKKYIHLILGILFALLPVISIFLAAGQLITPAQALLIFACCTLLLAMNLASGITYGILRKSSKVYLAILSILHAAVLAGFLFYESMMIIVITA